MLIKQSTSTEPLVFLMTDSSDHITGKTSISPTVVISKNGGSFTTPSGGIGEIGYGWYQVSGNILDTNTLGCLLLHASNASTDPTDMRYEIVAYDPRNTSTLGLTAFADISGNMITHMNNMATVSGTITTINNNLNTVSGNILTNYNTLVTISGNLGTVVAGVPLANVATSGTLVYGTNISGNYLSTQLINNAYWVTAPSGSLVGGFSLNQQMNFNVGTARISDMRIAGRFTAGASRAVDIWAWNYVTNAFESISSSTTRMNNSANDANYTYTFLPNHQGPSGAALVRFTSTSVTTTDRLWLDQVLVYSVTVGTTSTEIANAVYSKMSTTVYSDGVWIDTIVGTSGTEIGINGLSTNPVNNIAEAYVLASGLGFKRFYFRPDSNVALTQSAANWRFVGKGIINLNNQDISDAIFEDLEMISGVSTGQDANFRDCVFQNITLDSCWIQNSWFRGTVITKASGSYSWVNCVDDIPGAVNPTVVCALSGQYGLRNYRGGINIDSLSSPSQFAIDGNARVIINSNCTGGTLIVRGCSDLFDNVSGGFASVGTLTQTARYNVSQPTNNITDISNIITSGNAQGWNNTSSLTGISGTLATISGNLLTVNNTLNTVSGNLNATSGDINTLRTNFTTTSGDVTQIKNNVVTVSGNILTLQNNVTTISGNLVAVPSTLNTVSGNLNTVNNTLNTVSGIVNNLPTITTIVASGNAAGWNSTTTVTTVTVSGYTPDALSQIVTSGNAAGWNSVTSVTGISGQIVTLQNNVTTVSGDLNTLRTNFSTTSGDVNTIKNNVITVSGNLLTLSNNASTMNNTVNTISGNLNTTNTTVNTINSNLTTISGNILTVQNNLGTVSGNLNTLPTITTIVASGNAAGWNSVTSIVNVTVSGLTPGALGQIVASGNAANWNADTNPVTVSGFTPASLSQIVVSGHSDGWASVTPVTDLSGISGQLVNISGGVSTANSTLNTVSGQITLNNSIISTVSGNVDTVLNNLNTISGNLNTGVQVSGLTPSALSEIVSSGNAANWAADTINVTVSGITPSALSQIVASGTAAGWSNTTIATSVTVSGWSGTALTDLVSGVLETPISELTTVPSATPTLHQIEMLKYMQMSNSGVQENPTDLNKYAYIYNSSGTPLFKTSIYDNAISGIFIKGKIETV